MSLASTVNGSQDHVREIHYSVDAAMSDHERRTNGTTMTPDAQRQLAVKLIAREVDDRSVARGMQGEGVLSDAEETALRTAVFASMFGVGPLDALLDCTFPLPMDGDYR